MLTLRKAELKALVDHASKDQTGLHLSSVFFDAPFGAVVAAGGHRMALRYHEPFGRKDFLLPAAQLRRVLSVMQAGDTVKIASSAADVSDKDGNRLCVFPLNARAPDVQPVPYWTVIPEMKARRETVPVAVSADYIRDAMSAISSILSGRHFRGAVISCGETERDVVEVTALDPETEALWMILVMPGRYDADGVTKKARAAALFLKDRK